MLTSDSLERVVASELMRGKELCGEREKHDPDALIAINSLLTKELLRVLHFFVWLLLMYWGGWLVVFPCFHVFTYDT